MSEDVGARLRYYRELKGLSQRELAKRADVTNSSISLIEQGRVSPSIASLKKVLSGLPMSLAQFFSSDLPEVNKFFFKSEDVLEVSSGGTRYKLLGAGLENSSMQMMYETYPAGSDTGEEMLSHHGEEGGVIVSGEIELTVDGKVQCLQPGDGYYFESKLKHRFRNIGDEPCVIVSANNPPSF